MSEICNTCKYFRANMHTDSERIHHCDFQKVALSEVESRQSCDECVPKENKGCTH